MHSSTTVLKDVRVSYCNEVKIVNGKKYYAGFPCELKEIKRVSLFGSVWVPGQSRLGTLYEVHSNGMKLGEIMLDNQIQVK